MQHVFEIENEKPKTQITKLALRRTPKGISLVTLDESGNIDWYVATVRHDGVMELHGDLSSLTGLALDSNGRIKTDA